MEQGRNLSQQPKNIQNKRRKRRGFPALKFLVVVILLCISAWFLLAHILTDDSGYEIPIGPPAPANILNSMPQGNSRILTFEYLAQISNDHLLLVNREYAIPDNIPGELAKVTDYVRTLNVGLLMNREALLMLQEMFASAADTGHTQFRVTEAYRTHERQQELYNAIADKSLVAVPGHSEHQTGLAADISYHGVNIANSIQGTWLTNNSYRYGFILRYPQHRTHITGFLFEPWHYRFVGQPHAWYMRQNDVVLEEYIYYLRKHGGITIIFNETEYWIYYLSDADDSIELPENFIYTASLDNTGGIIVTAWLDY